ncbi:nuclease [Sulfurifustis variabilis]|uniref:Nuclease n=1 Tax=Sulfurifustis variabilis TaxID=1675686 RepID=A0A1B4VDH1_9GAMM|nr:thermonuclease family protein [Sulfurifustis variabilis]BAU47967.1 nuclease [Sulfurifustis variabilis]
MTRWGWWMLWLPLAAAQAAELSGNAFVNDDATLRIEGRTMRLYGIHIPNTGQDCATYQVPIRCASRAALALEFRIQDFVRCTPLERNADGTYSARCESGGYDLAAYLVERGWALALPDAPFEYVALERIARSRGVGVWGFPLSPRAFEP